jgi:hypothetical protein
MIVPSQHAPTEGCRWLGPGRCAPRSPETQWPTSQNAGQPKQMAVAQQLSSNVQGGPGKSHIGKEKQRFGRGEG